jgi:hypothetical protein
MARGNKRGKSKMQAPDLTKPAAEQMEHGDFERVIIPMHGIRWRRVPVIVTLADQGKLSERQFTGLARYRDVGIACERSPVRDSCDFSVKGNGEGLPPAALRALTEMGWLERQLGALRTIAYAIAIEDVTLSEWAIRQGGSVMRSRQGPKDKIIRWFEPKRQLHKLALVDIRMAGERLAAAIAA